MTPQDSVPGRRDPAPAPQAPAPQGPVPAPEVPVPAPQAPVPAPQNLVPAPQDPVHTPQDLLPAGQDPDPAPPQNPASPIGAPAAADPILAPRRTPGPMSLISLALGLLIIAWPLAWAPAWAFAVGAIGAAAVLAAAFRRWRQGPAIAVTAAIAAAAFSRAGTAALAAEGLFILGYLLAADAPLVRPGQWLKSQLRLCVAGVIASGAVLAALALHPASSPWLAVVGLAAAVAAYLTVLPSARQLSHPRAETATRPRQAAADPEHTDPVPPERTGTA
jgi:hypothetical protein